MSADIRNKHISCRWHERAKGWEERQVVEGKGGYTILEGLPVAKPIKCSRAMIIKSANEHLHPIT